MMMKTEQQNLTINKMADDPVEVNRGQMVRILILPVLVVIVAAAGVWSFIIVRNGQWMPMSRELLYASVIAILGTITGSGALSAIWHYRADYLPQGILAAMGLKMLVTLAGFLIFGLIFKPLRLEFVLYLAVFYFIGLISETVITVKMTRRMNQTSGPADKT